MTDRELMQMALDALEKGAWDTLRGRNAAEALRSRLAQPEPEGKYSDIISDGGLDPRRKFDVAPQREWQGLTDDERTYIAWESNNGPECVAMTEAKLKEKNS